MMGCGMDVTVGLWAITIFAWVIGFVITFFLIRFAVRANEQVALLKTISEKQNAQIDLLIAAIHKDDK